MMDREALVLGVNLVLFVAVLLSSFFVNGNGLIGGLDEGVSIALAAALFGGGIIAAAVMVVRGRRVMRWLGAGLIAVYLAFLWPALGV